MSIDPNILVNNNQDAQYLTCVTCNYYSILQYHNASQISTALGKQFYFEFKGDSTEELSYTFEKQSNEDNIRSWTGHSASVTSAKNLDEFLHIVETQLEANNPVFVYGNGYEMAWTPFYQKEHVEHTFIISNYEKFNNWLQVVDTYVNNTKYGKATPNKSRIDVQALNKMVRDVPGHDDYKLLFFVNGGKPREINEDTINEIFRQTNDEYLEAANRNIGLNRLIGILETRSGVKELISELSLLFWLGLRAREYYHRWLGEVSESYLSSKIAELLVEVETKILPKWKKINEVTFILSRRAERGEVSLDAIVDLLKSISDHELQYVDLLHPESNYN